MSDRINILMKKFDLQFNACMSTLMEMREEATKLQQGDMSMSALQTGSLTDEQITKLLTKRELTIQRKHKS